MPAARNSRRPRREALLLLCISVPSFMISLDANVVAVSLPSIAQSLQADFAAIEWVISAYTLMFASLLLPAGAYADRFGRKGALQLGLIIFTAASFLCGAAPNVLVLNLARALQGIGAALQLSACLALLAQEFRGLARARAFAFWGSVVGLAITLGPVVGGVLTEHFGWRSAFYINLPVGLALVPLVRSVMNDSRDPEAKRFDVAGATTFGGALFLLTLALIAGNHQGWQSPIVLVELIGAAALLVTFAWIERRVLRPMLDLGLFRRPTFLGATLAGLSYAGAFFTMLTYLPMYFQTGLALTAQQAGLMMLPFAVPLILVPRFIAPHLTLRWSGRTILCLSTATLGLGMLLLAEGAPALRYGAMLPGMLLAGLGAGLLNGETAKVAMTVIPPERAGMASGISGTIRFTGVVIGFAVLGAILFERVQASLATKLTSSAASGVRELAHRIVAGDLSGLDAILPGGKDTVLTSLAAGYQAIFLTAAVFALASALAGWFLISPLETAPPKEEADVPVVLVAEA